MPCPVALFSYAHRIPFWLPWAETTVFAPRNPYAEGDVATGVGFSKPFANRYCLNCRLEGAAYRFPFQYDGVPYSRFQSGPHSPWTHI